MQLSDGQREVARPGKLLEEPDKRSREVLASIKEGLAEFVMTSKSKKNGHENGKKNGRRIILDDDDNLRVLDARGDPYCTHGIELTKPCSDCADDTELEDVDEILERE